VDGTTGSDANSGTSWASAKQTIQAAMNVASRTGGDVLVKGSQTYYYPSLTMRPFTYLFGSCTSSDTTRPSHTSALGSSVLDESSQGPVVSIRGGNRTCLIDGFKITNGYTTENGGGIRSSSASPVIRYNTIIHNYATSTAPGNGYGGGIYCMYGSPEITGNVIGQYNYGNHATFGGGVALYFSMGIVRQNRILYNYALTKDGGGIYTKGSSDYGNISIENNFINNNYANGNGCGIHIEGTSAQTNACVIDFNTITANTTGTSGEGGVYITGTTTTNLTNNIIWHNNSGIYAANDISSLAVTKNCVFGNVLVSGDVNYTSNVVHATDINSDPGLTLTSYVITQSSVCYNAANTNWPPCNVDLEGRYRPNGSASDIGCYEYY